MGEILNNRSPVELSLRDMHFEFTGPNRVYEIWLLKDGERKGTDIIIEAKPSGILTFSDKLGVLLKLKPSCEKKGSVSYMKITH